MCRNENLDSKNWVWILNMKLEIQNRIWADRNLESKTHYLFKNQSFFSQKANSRFFLDLWYWITTIYMYLKFVVFLNQETWKTIKLNMMNLIFLVLTWSFCLLRSSSLKLTTFSELQTRHFKQGKISCSTRECQKSSADR